MINRSKALFVIATFFVLMCVQGRAVNILWDELDLNLVGDPAITGDIDNSSDPLELVEGENLVFGSFSIENGGINPISGEYEYSFDIDNFRFEIAPSDQLNSIEIKFVEYSFDPGADWLAGLDPIPADAGLHYDLLFPFPDSFKFNPHVDPIDHTFLGAFPLLEGVYDYTHGLRAITGGDFEFVRTSYIITFDVSDAGGASVPDSGSTMLLSLFGLSCLFGAKRYSKK